MWHILLILIGSSSYGILSTFVVKAYGSGFTVNEVTGSMFIYGFLLMAALMAAVRNRHMKADLKSVSMRSLRLLGPIGLSIGMTSMLYYVSLQYIPASLAIVLLFQFAWIGVLIESVIKRALPDKHQLTALFLVLAGTVFAAGIVGGDFSNISWFGFAMGLSSGVSYAIFIVLNGRAALHVNPYTRSTISSLIAMILVLAVYPPTFFFHGAWGGELLMWGGLLAVFGIVVPTVCFAIAVPRVGGGVASILGSIELPVAVLLSGFALGEQVHGWQWMGVVIILVGVIWPEAIGRKRVETAG